ncbi:MAG: type I pullulanase [Clostridiales bacterium]|nr:type I pullulanase [Clostridiales bacterium]
MKRLFKAGVDKCKQFLLLLIAVAVAVMAMPIGLIGSTRGAKADVVTGEHDGGEPNVATSAGDSYKLTLNYYRAKGDYTNWNLWAWSTGVGGKRYDAESTTFEVVDKAGETKQTNWLTFTVEMDDVTLDGEKVMGIIVRRSEGTNDWAEKAVDKDIWVPLSTFDEQGEATIFMADKLDELYTNAQDAYDNKVIRKMDGASFKNFTTVKATFNTTVTDKSVFVLKDSAGNVLRTLLPKGKDEEADKTKNFAVGSTYVEFDLGDDFEIDFGEVYTVYDEPTETEFDPEINYPAHDVIAYSLYDTTKFNELYAYDGTLGAQYSIEKTIFTTWSPMAKSVKVALYAAGEGGEPIDEIEMEKGEKGSWTATVEGQNLDGIYYTYKIENSNGTVKEVVDPYARSAGRNGKRGMILDLSKTNPEGWENHKRPAARGSYSQAVIYEAHIRDLTMDENSNVSAAHKGKFLGLTETSTDASKKTPLDYIKDLGITELHILPMFDINSVDEYTGNATYDGVDDNGNGQYNWGYDPLNYNVPEGSYSTDPTDGKVRVNELKQMVKALHEAGIRVIMDVVYNHVADVEGSNFQALMPGYYFRTYTDGSWKQASGCGNDTASERAMYRKFMVDSVNYWADEYQLDGFRFDLMGLHDTVTMNMIYDTLAEKNPDIMIYGEGWEMASLETSREVLAANMYNASKMPNIAFFNDGTRDTLKGGGYGQSITANGFISGAKNDGAVYMGAVGGTNNPDAGYSYTGKRYFAANPTQNVSYVSCHDNSTLWDKINASTKGVDNDTRKAMNRLAATAVFTSQGASFMLAGEEMLRDKETTKDNTYDNRPEKWADSDHYFADNSYKSPDSVNAIKWELAQTNADMVNFYKQLIAIKKSWPQFHLTTRNQVLGCVKIVDAKMTDGLTAYTVRDPNSDEYAVVLFNATAEAAEIKIPQGDYGVYVNGAQANATTALSTFSGNSFNVGAYSAVVMKAELDEDKLDAWEKEVKPVQTPPTPAKPNTPAQDEGDDDDNLGLALGLGIGIPAAVLIAGGAVFGVMYGKKKKGGKGGDKAQDSATPEASDKPESEQTADQPENAEAPQTEQEQPQETENQD